MAELQDFNDPVLKCSGRGGRGQVYHIPDGRSGKHPIPACDSRRANNYNIFERKTLAERSNHDPCSRCYGPDGEGGLKIEAEK